MSILLTNESSPPQPPTEPSNCVDATHWFWSVVVPFLSPRDVWALAFKRKGNPPTNTSQRTCAKWRKQNHNLNIVWRLKRDFRQCFLWSHNCYSVQKCLIDQCVCFCTARLCDVVVKTHRMFVRLFDELNEVLFCDKRDWQKLFLLKQLPH